MPEKFLYFTKNKFVTEKVANELLSMGLPICAYNTETKKFEVTDKNGNKTILDRIAATKTVVDAVGEVVKLPSSDNKKKLVDDITNIKLLDKISVEKINKLISLTDLANQSETNFGQSQKIYELNKEAKNLKNVFEYEKDFESMIKKAPNYKEDSNNKIFDKVDDVYSKEELDNLIAQIEKESNKEFNPVDGFYGQNLFESRENKGFDPIFINDTNANKANVDLNDINNNANNIEIDENNIIKLNQQNQNIKIDNQVNELGENKNKQNEPSQDVANQKKVIEAIIKSNQEAAEDFFNGRKHVNRKFFDDSKKVSKDFENEIFGGSYTFFNSFGPLTPERAFECYKNKRTLGILDENNVASLVRTDGNDIYKHSMDHHSTYKKMEELLEKQKHWYNVSSQEYKDMSSILKDLSAADDDLKESFCLGELRYNINRYKKKFRNKQANDDVSKVAQHRYNAVLDMEKYLKEIERDRAVEHRFDDARVLAETKKEDPDYDFDFGYDMKDAFEPEDMDVYEDKDFDLNEYLRADKGNIHDYLAEAAKFAAEHPDNKTFFSYLKEAAEQIASGEEDTEATEHFKDAIGKGKAGDLTYKDFAALEADRKLKKGDAIVDQVAKAFLLWDGLKLVNLILLGTGPLGIAAAFLKSFLISAAMKIAWGVGKKIYKTVEKYKGDKKAAKEYASELRHGRTDKAKSIRKAHMASLIKRMKAEQAKEIAKEKVKQKNVLNEENNEEKARKKLVIDEKKLQSSEKAIENPVNEENKNANLESNISSSNKNGDTVADKSKANTKIYTKRRINTKAITKTNKLSEEKADKKAEEQNSVNDENIRKTNSNRSQAFEKDPTNTEKNSNVITESVDELNEKSAKNEMGNEGFAETPTGNMEEMTK